MVGLFAGPKIGGASLAFAHLEQGRKPGSNILRGIPGGGQRARRHQNELRETARPTEGSADGASQTPLNARDADMVVPSIQRRPGYEAPLCPGMGPGLD